MRVSINVTTPYCALGYQLTSKTPPPLLCQDPHLNLRTVQALFVSRKPPLKTGFFSETHINIFFPNPQGFPYWGDVGKISATSQRFAHFPHLEKVLLQ